jgi:hypothetical protein
MPARITQPFRNRADAADLVPYEDHGMSPEAPIIDFAERHTHGLDVVLMWSRVSGCVWVNVTNRGTAGRHGSKPRRLPRSRCSSIHSPTYGRQRDARDDPAVAAGGRERRGRLVDGARRRE